MTPRRSLPLLRAAAAAAARCAVHAPSRAACQPPEGTATTSPPHPILAAHNMFAVAHTARAVRYGVAGALRHGMSGGAAAAAAAVCARPAVASFPAASSSLALCSPPLLSLFGRCYSRSSATRFQMKKQKEYHRRMSKQFRPLKTHAGAKKRFRFFSRFGVLCKHSGKYHKNYRTICKCTSMRIVLPVTGFLLAGWCSPFFFCCCFIV